MEQVWYIELAWMVAKILAVIVPLLIGVAYLTLAERRVIGFMQLRKGPNVVGPFGLFQPFADALKLMAKIDPKTALKLAAELAREMKGAVKAYAEAGGRNVSTGDLALIRKQASDALQAREAAAEAGLDTTSMEAQLKALGAREEDAVADHGFFEEVKRIVAGLKKARQDIRGEAITALNPPSEAEWKAADRDQAELEREIDRAAAGPAVSIRI